MKKILLGAVLFGCCATLVLFQKYFQMPFPSYRRSLIIVAAFFTLSAGAFLVYMRLVQPRWEKLGSKARATLLGTAVLLPSLYLLMQGVQTEGVCFYVFAPKHHLEITLPAEAPADQVVELIWFKTTFEEVNLNLLTRKGEWNIIGASQAIGQPGEAISLSWEGKTGAEALLVFKPTAESVVIQINWDGRTEEIDLQRPGVNAEVKYSTNFTEGVLISQIIFLAAVWLFGAMGLYALGVVLATQDYGRPVRQPRKAEWLLYALPMIVVWGIYLLTYWPGMMTADSMTQWRQAQSGVFDDWHPAIHTMIIWALTRIWNHPAVEGVFQILALSLTVAWGLKTLRDFGVRPLFLWLGSLLFALLPINGSMVITYWKDIPYSISMLAFFIVYLKLFLTRGMWLESRGNLAGMVGISLAASLFRHNGFLTVMLSLLPLFFLFRPRWKSLLSVLVLLIGLRFLIRGPFYDALNVTKHSGQSNLILIHHVAAHINAGTPLTPEERVYLNSVLPLPDWPYDCTYAGDTTHSPGFSRSVFEQSSWTLRKISLSLFLRNPLIELKHTLCNGQLVWALPLNIHIQKAPLWQEPGTYRWIIDNSYDIVEASLIPRLVPLLTDLYDLTYLQAHLWKPAFYLLIILLCVPIMALRQRFSLLLLSPPFFQALIVFAFNIVQAFRFMYPVCLIALFCLVGLFLPVVLPEEKRL